MPACRVPWVPWAPSAEPLAQCPAGTTRIRPSPTVEHAISVDPATLAPTRHIDSDHPAIRAFTAEHAADLPPREAAVALYYAVRDGLRYNPWRVRFLREDYLASEVLGRDRSEGGHCIDKALLLAADAAGASRIVLKRPPDAAVPETPIGAPTFEISTRLLRWSVWERRSSSG